MSQKNHPPRVWIDREFLEHTDSESLIEASFKKEMPNDIEYISQEEVNALLAEERAKGIEQVYSEIVRKQKVIERLEVGHSAQSFGQAWAYGEIKEFCETQIKAAREEKKSEK